MCLCVATTLVVIRLAALTVTLTYASISDGEEGMTD